MTSNSTAPSPGSAPLANQGGLITPASVIAVGAVLPALSILFVGLRFYGRRFQSQGFGTDDLLIAISLLLTIGLGIMMIAGAALGGFTPGTGPANPFTTQNNALLITEKLFWSFNVVQCLAFGTAKLSVLYFYRRIFRGKAFDYTSIFMIVIVGIWTVGFFFATLFRCGSRFWVLWATLNYLAEYCYVSTPAFLAFSITDVLTDVMILSIAVIWTWQIQMTIWRRLVVCGIFLLGGLVIAFGIVRLDIYVQQTNNPYQNKDGTGHLTTEVYWSMIEMGISIVAACLPTIRPLFGNFSPQTAIRSVRSILSLHSLGSRNHEVRSPPDQEAASKYADLHKINSKSTKSSLKEGHEANHELDRREHLEV